MRVDLGDEEAREETCEEDEAHSVVYVWSVFTMKRIGAKAADLYYLMALPMLDTNLLLCAVGFSLISFPADTNRAHGLPSISGPKSNFSRGSFTSRLFILLSYFGTNAVAFREEKGIKS
jgi:hypothetical protein